jgi:hypothetical protein
MTEPQLLHPAACPTCQRPFPLVDSYRPLTDRELDALSGWWHYRSVKLTAMLIGVGEQRAKNLLASARSKAGIHSNEELVEKYLGQLRSVADIIAQRMRNAR